MSTELLDSPIAFHRAFVRLGAGITGALMLSQAMYWSKRTKDAEGWFYKTQAEWEDETGLSRYEQENARSKLKKLGVFLEKRRGVPCKTYYRVDTQKLDELLSQSAEKPQSSMRDSSNLGCGKPADKNAENPQTSSGDSREQDGGNSANKLGEIQQTITEITTETTQRLPRDYEQETHCASGCATDEPEPPPTESPPAQYQTAKGKTLQGDALEHFTAFWKAFAYPKNKARAADAWLKIPWARKQDPDAAERNRELLLQIMTAAAFEASQREAKVAAGITPIYAEGWLTARRWEDEHPDLMAQRQQVRDRLAHRVVSDDPKAARQRVRDALQDIHNTDWGDDLVSQPGNVYEHE